MNKAFILERVAYNVRKCTIHYSSAQLRIKEKEKPIDCGTNTI